MTIAVGDRVPANITLFEYIEPAEGCSAGPKPVAVTEETAGRTIALFGLPGEKPPFTLTRFHWCSLPTCRRIHPDVFGAACPGLHREGG